MATTLQVNKMNQHQRIRSNHLLHFDPFKCYKILHTMYCLNVGSLNNFKTQIHAVVDLNEFQDENFKRKIKLDETSNS